MKYVLYEIFSIKKNIVKQMKIYELIEIIEIKNNELS